MVHYQGDMMNRIPPNPIPFDWEEISPNVYRAKTIGGWIVFINENGMVFIPDPLHEWEIK